MNYTLLVTILLSTVLLSCSPQKEKTEETAFTNMTALIDQYAKESLQSGHINSVALAIYKNGHVYHNYYGEIDKNAGNTPDDSTLYEIASISKAFTGSLVARAVIENKLSLDDDIRKYLNSDYPNLEYKEIPITIKDLLTHTLGLKNKTPPGFQKTNDKIKAGYYNNHPLDYGMNDLLEELKSAEVDKQPGTVHAYTSVGPELLSYILEQIYNRPFAEILDLFLSELNMDATHILNADYNQRRPCNGYNENGQIVPLDITPLLGGAGGMVSTLPDLVKFMKFQLESDAPLINESRRLLYEDDDDNIMGYLWEDLGVAEEEGFYYSKTGTALGVQSGLLICPDSDYGMIIIINNNSDDALDQWAHLYNTVETDLIKYPKINLKNVLKEAFLTEKPDALRQFNVLSQDTSKYFNTNLTGLLNSLGYDLLYAQNDPQKSIKIFKFAISQDPNDANLYDSLGEAYFASESYEESLVNYKKSLELNPKNNNAKAYISAIKELLNRNI